MACWHYITFHYTFHLSSFILLVPVFCSVRFIIILPFILLVVLLCIVSSYCMRSPKSSMSNTLPLNYITCKYSSIDLKSILQIWLSIWNRWFQLYNIHLSIWNRCFNIYRFEIDTSNPTIDLKSMLQI